MKKNFKLIVSFVLILICGISFFSIPLVRAESTLVGELDVAAKQGGLLKEGVKAPELTVVIGKYIEIGLSFVGILFLIMVIYGGLRWMTASGNPAEVKKARSVLIHSAIGLFVTLAAYSVVYFAIKSVGQIVQ